MSDRCVYLDIDRGSSTCPPSRDCIKGHDPDENGVCYKCGQIHDCAECEDLMSKDDWYSTDSRV
jgi:hypothetical protein